MEHYTLEAAAKMLDASISEVRDLVRSGALSYVDIGQVRYITGDSLKRYINHLKQRRGKAVQPRGPRPAAKMPPFMSPAKPSSTLTHHISEPDGLEPGF